MSELEQPRPAPRLVERKWGPEAARLHIELVDAIARTSNDLSADVIRRIIQDLICGRFHDPKTSPRARRKLLVESLKSIPHDRPIHPWARDITRRARHGAFIGDAAS